MHLLLNFRTALSGYCIAVAAVAVVDFERRTCCENSSTTVVTEWTERRWGRRPAAAGTPTQGQTGGS